MSKLIFEKDTDKDWGEFYRVYSEDLKIKYLDENSKKFIVENHENKKFFLGFILSYSDENIYRFRPDEDILFGIDALIEIVDFLKELNKH